MTPGIGEEGGIIDHEKTAAFLVTASLASSTLFAFSPAISAHALTQTQAEQSIPQGPKAALNSIYQLAHKGQMPYYAEGLKIGVQTKKTYGIN